MESASTAKYQKFIQMMETFASGRDTSHQFVSAMEAEFWTCGLNEDERFNFDDLMMALDMFAVPTKDFGYNCDPKHLTSQCRYALKVLRDEL